MTPATDGSGPANPICLAWISAPSAGAAENWSAFPIVLYALVVELSDGYWTTPSIVTITFSFDAGDFERENSVFDPSPVKLSTSLSYISNVLKLF